MIDELIKMFRNFGWSARRMVSSGFPDIITIDHGHCRFFICAIIPNQNWKDEIISNWVTIEQLEFAIEEPLIDILLVIKTTDGNFCTKINGDFRSARFRDVACQPWGFHGRN